MAINALIAQGLRPIGADVPQIGNMLNEKRQMDTRNALAQRGMAIDETNSQNYQNSLMMQREAASQRAKAERMEAIRQQAGSVLDNLQSIAGTPDYGVAFSKLQANPLVAEVARTFGIDVADLADPKNLPVARSLVGLDAAPAPVSLSAENVGGFRVLRDSTGKVINSQAPERPQTGGETSQQLITRPVGNDGMVQDFAWNPKTNQTTPRGAPYKPATTYQGNVTEGERKAAALGTRLEAAMQEIAAVEVAAPGASRPGLMERGLESMGMEAAANVARSSERQRADAAQLDALDAALTLATGAAYTREQLQNLRKSYFPQIGDTPEQVAAKAKRFETIVQTARIAAGRAEPSIDRAVNSVKGQQGAPPSAGERKTVGGKTYVKQGDQWYEEQP